MGYLNGVYPGKLHQGYGVDSKQRTYKKKCVCTAGADQLLKIANVQIGFPRSNLERKERIAFLSYWL
jgi:hypothetical protein